MMFMPSLSPPIIAPTITELAVKPDLPPERLIPGHI
jgi:hypothetical protein